MMQSPTQRVRTDVLATDVIKEVIFSHLKQGKQGFSFSAVLREEKETWKVSPRR